MVDLSVGVINEGDPGLGLPVVVEAEWVAFDERTVNSSVTNPLLCAAVQFRIAV